MALPSSGPLSLTDIQTEFGGSNPIGINEYYAGGGLVPAGTTGTYGAVPTSGQISIQNFYGTANYYTVNNSLRFRASASAYLSRTPASAGSQTTWTLSFWFKKAVNTASDQYLFSNTNASNVGAHFRITNDSIDFSDYNGSSFIQRLVTTQVFRDPSAWYHIVYVFDTTQATASNRIKLYVNGSQVTAFSTATYPAQNYTGYWNTTSPAAIMRNVYATAPSYTDGYLAEVNFINGQALTPSSFGATNSATGVWQPISYTGTYGTNGFYLKFSDIATTSGSNAGLGKDFSGNGNYWNTNNISVTAGVTYDAMTDSPTWASATVANYCTGNPLDVSVRGSFSNANLTATCNGGGALQGGSARLNTFNFTQLPVKWYWEATVTNDGSGRAGFGMITNSYIAQNENWSSTGGWFLRADGVQSNLTNPGSFTTNDVMMFAYDGNTGKVWIGKNGTWTNSGVPASGTGQNATLTVGTEYWLLFNENTGGAGTAVCAMNFGQRPFVYTPPTNFLRVNTYNIPTPTIGATSSTLANKYMDATLYTGTSAVQSITNAGAFKPDYLWIKCRSAINNNTNFDSTRGVLSQLYSNLTNAETVAADGLAAFNSNGFSLDNTGSGGNVNVSGRTYVAWQWNANNGTTSSNTNGSITSTVQANTTAKFSIVTYTGNGVAGATVGHGLGVAPSLIIVKNRTNSGHSWAVRHVSLTSTQNLALQNLDGAYTVSSATSNGGVGTSASATFGFISGTVGLLNVNASSNNYVAYCWAEIAGFSKFGNYTANGSTDGPFIYLGFRPKFVMIKNTNLNTENWLIMDSSRDTYNLSVYNLWPNLSSAEQNGSSRSPQVVMDFLSNGIKLRGINNEINSSTNSYIYAAFAESPFKYALAR